MRWLALLAFNTLACLSAPAWADEPYAVSSGSSCGGFPRITIELQAGVCAGLVVAKGSGMRMPRTLTPLPGSSDWLVADMGGWGVKAGAIWRLTARPGEPPKLTRLLSKLNMPNTIAIGPDGRAYVGEMGRIFSFDPTAANIAATVRDIVVDLPSNLLHADRHPLSAFAFAPDGALLVNIGAPSDQCLGEDHKPVGPRCAEGESAEAAGLIRRYAPAGTGRWSIAFTVFASGLRNSMAMATTPTGAMLQAENSIDIADDHEPFDEINLLEAGRHYGWPYCMDANKATPGWAGTHAMDCASAAHTAPVALLPPHSAPLGMSYYSGGMFPALKGRLLVSLHGYRPAGARILAFDTDARGLPTGKPVDLTPGWLALKGVRPRGRPVGMAVATDGAIWVADDRNGAIIRFAADRPG